MEHTRVPIEAGAAAIVAGTFIQILPPMAAAFAICWYCIQIWQSDTGKAWRQRWRRLFARQLTTEDRIAFVLLGFGVTLPPLAVWGLGF